MEIGPGVRISEHELHFTAERSPGPGGQNVNKSNTRVTLHFNVAGSVSLSSQQKTRIQERLSSRITKDGYLRIISSKERTQLANRRAATNRLVELLSGVFKERKPRKKTNPPVSANVERLAAKTRRGDLKRYRQSSMAIDD